jgi:hypothetical protein
MLLLGHDFQVELVMGERGPVRGYYCTRCDCAMISPSAKKECTRVVRLKRRTRWTKGKRIHPMQMMIPHEVIEGLVTSGVLAVAGLIAKFALKGVKGEIVKEINEIVTQNANRTRSEMITDFEAKHAENKSVLSNHIDEDRKEFRRINLKLDQIAGGH